MQTKMYYVVDSVKQNIVLTTGCVTGQRGRECFNQAVMFWKVVKRKTVLSKFHVLPQTMRHCKVALGMQQHSRLKAAVCVKHGTVAFG